MGNNKSKGGKKEKSKAKRTLTVLTLGISGSGKSTFAKQMKILYCGGFGEDDKNTYKDILLQNVVLGMQEVVKQAKKLELQVTEDNRKHARFFLELNATDHPWEPEYVEKLQTLWTDPAIQQTWSQAPEYQMQMSLLDYHMGRLPTYALPNYVPSDEDMLRARQRTTGSVATTFVIDKTEWKILDCGGQRPERAKWESILDENEVSAVIFFAALDEFNMASMEEMGKTKMQIAMECFKEVASSSQTRDKSILLFLNKKDLFEKKFSNKKDFETFQKTFPKYSGGKDTKAATDFLAGQFKQIMSQEERQDELYVHSTCALDTDAMKAVFTAVRETLFMNKMSNGMGM